MIKCEIDGKEFKDNSVLARHLKKVYKLTLREYYHKHIVKNDNIPTCKCGCTQIMKWKSPMGYTEYGKGHAARVLNNWGHNKMALEKSIVTRKGKFENGEIKIWCDGLTSETSDILKNAGIKISNNKERNKKISESLKGKEKSEEHKSKIKSHMKEFWGSDINREKQSHTRMLYMKQNGWEKISNLEIKIKNILDLLCIKYHQQHYVREIKGLFDFYLSDKLYVEIHGDFWHCNPISKYNIPKYDAQIKNLEMDRIKKNWCEKNGIELVIIWESDINTNVSLVISNLLLKLKHD